MLRRSLTAADLKEYLNADGMPSLASSLRDTVDGDKLASAFGFGCAPAARRAWRAWDQLHTPPPLPSRPPAPRMRTAPLFPPGYLHTLAPSCAESCGTAPALGSQSTLLYFFY